jgi:hypothetical protein
VKRAKVWREKAASLLDPERALCQQLAQGDEKPVIEEATIRTRLLQIWDDLHAAPSINAQLLTQEYAKRHGVDGRVHEIAAALLVELFDPVCRANISR